MRSVFEIYFYTCLAIYLFGIYARGRARTRQNRITDDRKWAEAPYAFFAFAGMEVLPLVYAFTRWFDRLDYTLPVWAGVLGMLAFAASLWMVWRAHHDLGRHWSPTLQVHAEQQLVTNGIYRSIRHPIYASQWLWGLAQVLLLQNWVVGLAGLITFAPVFFYRLKREEAMMLEHFGDDYRAYMGRTGAIWPKLGG